MAEQSLAEIFEELPDMVLLPTPTPFLTTYMFNEV